MSDESSQNPKGIQIIKGNSVTASERYLYRLCYNSFLSLWTYPSIFRDQGRKKGKGDGKENCDVSVVFGNHVILFSDKDCKFPATGNLKTDWCRWFRKAVLKSADQIWGAERWMRQYPDKLFLDKKCTQKFPLFLPDPSNAQFHRIVVAHDSSKRCREALGGSGSLMLNPSIQAEGHCEGNDVQPFAIGDIDPSRGYVHVLDDTTLDILLSTLTTVSDFVRYLTKKEEFIRSGKLAFACGEEDLLAFYLSEIDEEQEHAFIIPSGYTHIFIEEGEWLNFSQSKARAAQLAADEGSYLWDRLINRFAHHILGGTSYRATGNSFANQEHAVRWLAKEGRTGRRVLSISLTELLEKTPDRPGIRASRVMLPPRPSSPYYTFLLCGRFPGVAEEEYRTFRQMLLQAQCEAVKLRFPDALDIVGFATEPGFPNERSEDLLYLDARNWTSEMLERAIQLQKDIGLFTQLKETGRATFFEYPTQGQQQEKVE